MDGFPAFCQSNLPLIYGIYGLAFVVTGIAVWLESGRASSLALARALPLLAAFALMHGTHEWIEMYGLMLPDTPDAAPLAVEFLNVVILAASFLFLIDFAVRLIRLLEPERFDTLWLLTWVLGALYLASVIGYRVYMYRGDEALFYRVADILARYILGVSGAILACWAMFVQRRAFGREGYVQVSRDLIGAALAFAWYAIFQFVVPASPYFPSNLVNADTFQTYTGIPVQLFRAAVVLPLAFFVIRVMRVFEFEYARRLDALNRERFAAQESAARDLTVLYETCRILGSALDLNFLLNESLNRIVSLVERVRAGMVYLYDSGEQALVQRATDCAPGATLPPDLAERARTAAIRAFETREVAYEQRHAAESVLALPLISGDKPIGVLCLVHEGSFSNFAVLQTLARQLVIAIENARLYEEVQQKEELRGQLLERVVAAQEEERKRLARDLHDQTGQRLTALALGLSSVDELWDKNPARARERLRELEQMSASAIDDLRQVVSGLRPSLLDDLGLVAALRQMAKQIQENTDLEVEFTQSGHRRRLQSEIEMILYRIAQEALNNTVRHSRATRARINLDLSSNPITLTVEDNGCGFEPGSILKPNARVRAWGLLGMQERVELVGGKLEIESAPGRGTRLVVEIPLENNEVSGAH